MRHEADTDILRQESSHILGAKAVSDGNYLLGLQLALDALEDAENNRLHLQRQVVLEPLREGEAGRAA